MKVGIFTNAYHPIVSGVVNAIDCIERGLTQLGHHVYIICPRYSSAPAHAGMIEFPSIRLTTKTDFPLPFPYVPNLTRKIEQLHLDIVHAQHPFLLGNLGLRIAQRQKIPLVFTFHTRYEEYVHYAPPILPKSLLRFAVRKMVSSFVKHSNAVIIPSPSILDLVKAHGGDRRAVVIPNAINLTPFENANGDSVRNKYGLRGKKVLTFVGRLAEEKNLAFVIRVFSKIHSRIPNSALMLVGDGPHRKALEENAPSAVIFTGMVPYSEIPAYLAAADLFVTASTTEVKPLSLLESMACGVPVLAVKASGAIDTITDEVNGYLVHENEDEFAAAAVHLLSDQKKLKTLSENAKKTAEGFGISTMAKQLESLYVKLNKR